MLTLDQEEVKQPVLVQEDMLEKLIKQLEEKGLVTGKKRDRLVKERYVGVVGTQAIC